MTRVVVAPLVVAAALAAACLPSSTQCRADDECDDGLLCDDGRCGLRDDDDTDDGDDAGDDDGVDDAGGDDADDAGAVVPGEGEGEGEGDTGNPCPVVDDDQLTAAELPLAVGVELRMVEANDDVDGLPVDLQGQVAGDGVREWFFDADLPGDARIGVEAEPLDGKWFAATFPDATYTAKLDAAGDSYGVFRRTDDAVQILGVASAAPDETLLTYDPPVDALRFPLSVGAQWTSEAHNAGTFEGNAFYQSDDAYETSVDAAGRVVTEAGAFDVLRLRVVQTADVPVPWFPYVQSYRWVRYSFVTACYGEVAHVDSAEGETELQFSSAARVRRIGLGP